MMDGVLIFMDEFEEYIRKSEDRRELKRQKYFKQIADNVRDGALILKGMSLIVAQRFGVSADEEEYSPCWRIAEHYAFSDDIECNFVEWLHCDDAPFLCYLFNIVDYFPEFKGIAKSNKEIVKLANQVYGLDLEIEDYYHDYVYSFSLNFNSFVPIDLKKLIDLKQEIDFCRKYGLETEELESKLEDYGVSYEALGGESDEKIHS